MRELRGRVAVVTGAASGIGLALTEAFVAEGMHVVMVDRDEEKLRSHDERLNGQAAGSVHAVPTDVTQADQVERSAAAAVERFGALHVAVNNAGIVNRGYSWELVAEVEDQLRAILASRTGVV